MYSNYGWLAYFVLGTIGGLVGYRLKIPAGSMIAAMLTIIVFKIITRIHWEMPKGFGLTLQIILGVVVGASFQPSMLPVLKKVFFPVFSSSIALIGVGFLMAVVFTRMGILDASTAYLGTSPGAMSPLVILAFESGASATIVVCFHFIRVLLVILSAPLFLKLFGH